MRLKKIIRYKNKTFPDTFKVQVLMSLSITFSHMLKDFKTFRWTYLYQQFQDLLVNIYISDFTVCGTDLIISVACDLHAFTAVWQVSPMSQLYERHHWPCTCRIITLVLMTTEPYEKVQWSNLQDNFLSKIDSFRSMTRIWMVLSWWPWFPP